MILIVLRSMKSAVSIPDDIFEGAERAAKALGPSRGEPCATAVRLFVAPAVTARRGRRGAVVGRIVSSASRRPPRLNPTEWMLASRVVRCRAVAALGQNGRGPSESADDVGEPPYRLLQHRLRDSGVAEMQARLPAGTQPVSGQRRQGEARA